MSNELSGRSSASYAEQVKTELETITLPAELVAAMRVFDAQEQLQNARILAAMKSAVQTLALNAEQLAVIKGAYSTLGARFEL
jgi:multidrug efflux pump subunit AcrA (membrane-fusion protein)